MLGPKIDVVQNSLDSNQIEANIIVGFYPFSQHETYYNKSVQNTPAYAGQTGQLIVVSDVLSCTIRSAKTGHASEADLVLSAQDLDYQQRLSPGDYACIWLTDSVEQFNRVSNLVISNKQANQFDSGLKFVGKVKSVRTSFNTVESNGTRVVRYAVVMEGFSEFSAQVYYNPYLGDNYQSGNDSANANQQKLNNFWGSVSDKWAQLFTTGTYLNVGEVIDFFIKIFFGLGPKNANSSGIDTFVKSPNTSFIIPHRIANIFGITQKSQPDFFCFSDLLHTLIGIQQYRTSSNYDLNSSNIKTFVPLVLDSPDGRKNQRFCKVNISKNSSDPDYKYKLYGDLLNLPDPFMNSTIWSLLMGHSNPAINELFTTMRVNQDGNIMPTMVARQIPFTTEYAAKNIGQSLAYTKFTQLPVWDISSKLLQSFSYGTSDAARTNFVQVYGSMGTLKIDVQKAMTDMINRGNYRLDAIDLYRSGPKIQVVNSNLDLSKESYAQDLRDWTEIIADFYINGQLKLSGSATLKSVHPPFALGDNCIIDNKLFHIEGITYNYTVDEFSANRMVTTSFSLTNGVLLNGDYQLHGNPAGTRESLNSENLPGYTDEEVYINNVRITSGNNSKG